MPGAKPAGRAPWSWAVVWPVPAALVASPALAATGLILGAAYMLRMYRAVVFSRLQRTELRQLLDLSVREKLIFAPLVAMTILLGVYPSLVTDRIGPSVEALLTNYQTALHLMRTGAAGVIVGYGSAEGATTTRVVLGIGVPMATAIADAAATGRLVADLLTGQELPLDPAPFRPGRF